MDHPLFYPGYVPAWTPEGLKAPYIVKAPETDEADDDMKFRTLEPGCREDKETIFLRKLTIDPLLASLRKKKDEDKEEGPELRRVVFPGPRYVRPKPELYFKEIEIFRLHSNAPEPPSRFKQFLSYIFGW